MLKTNSQIIQWVSLLVKMGHSIEEIMRFWLHPELISIEALKPPIKPKGFLDSAWHLTEKCVENIIQKLLFRCR